jgi:hypothetical protein
MAKGKDYKNALQEAGSSTGRLGPAIRLHEPRMLHAALSKENHGRTLGFSTGQDGDSGNHPEIESKVQSKPPPSFL